MRARYRDANPRGRADGIPTGTVGAVSELLVAADLLARGAAVFRAMSPSCPCDLAILAGERLLRVEVKTGHVMPSGSLSYGRPTSGFDVLAVVIRATGEVRYFPTVSELLGAPTVGALPATIDLGGGSGHG